ncbi:MAG: hypothetical protein IT350_07455 [Deltaproteobacteria bacterium]|nr:hypothetical protein [Deltaproteobacteria bacterium]
MTLGLVDFERYLVEALAISVSGRPWLGGQRLPAFLRGNYAFFECEIDGHPCLIMQDRNREDVSPATVRKHMAMVRGKWSADVIYVCDRVTAYNRKRLIEQKVPFVVPGNQMYLPMSGIDLREHFRKLQTENRKFAPATQATIIHLLLNESAGSRITPTETAAALSYTPMTMTRVFNEIEAANLAAPIKHGIGRCLIMPGNLRDLWTNALPYLRSPIERRVSGKLSTWESPGPLAGIAALARYSDLAEPEHPTFAVSRERWKMLRQSGQVQELPSEETDAAQFEVWRYSPQPPKNCKVVDRLSLYLSLKDDPNERVEAALDELLRGVPW